MSVTVILSYVVTALIVLSILGALLTIITFSVFSNLRTYPIKLIMYLCLCLIVAYTAFLFAFESFIIDNDTTCKIVAILVHYFLLANFGWSLCIAINFFQMIVRRNRNSQTLEKWYHVFAWGYPIPLVVGNFITFSYGSNSGDVCYVDDALAKFFTFFLPGLFIISANTVLFFFLGREIHETLSSAPQSDRKERRKEFRVYISIFVSIGLSWIFGYIMLIVQVAALEFIFFLLFSFTVPLQGLMIFGSYCLNAKVMARWAGLFGVCLPCCKRWENMSTSTTASSSRM